MSDELVATLVGAVLGSVLTGAGAFGVAWFTGKAERKNKLLELEHPRLVGLLELCERVSTGLMEHSIVALSDKELERLQQDISRLMFESKWLIFDDRATEGLDEFQKAAEHLLHAIPATKALKARLQKSDELLKATEKMGYAYGKLAFRIRRMMVS